jgi:hypothetical protein
MNSLLQQRYRSIRIHDGEKERERNALATAPCAEITNKMIQRLGWLEVAECSQGEVFDSADELLASVRHGWI